MSQVDFSVVIPAYNEEELLPSTLKSLRQCMAGIEGLSGEIIVVDNASTDQTGPMAESLGARVVSESQRGIARARNKGASVALGEILIFVDADTLVPSKVMGSAISLMKDPSIGGGGATVRFDDHRGRFLFGIVVPALWNLLSRSLKLAAGSFVFCRKDDFDQVGGFSGKLYAGEEIFFVMRLKKILKRKKQKFLILAKCPVITSSRKLQWYGNLGIFSVLCLVLVFPLALRSKRLCAFWYQRPDKP